MIQDIAPHQLDNTYSSKRPPRPGDRILCFRKNEIFLRAVPESPSGYDFPSFEQLFCREEKHEIPAEQLCYLFSIDETGYFLMEEEDFSLSGLGEAAGFQSMQVFRAMKEGDTVPLVMMTGLHLYTWMRKNRYCGCCGHKTELHPVERALTCPNCRNLIFPQISPSVAVAVTDGDRILLARGLQSGSARFALIAGYVEIGESVEETVHREVLEEVGLQVKNLEYFKSQPWGLTGIEMMGFFAELDGSDAITVQETELAEARWFQAEEVNRDMPLHSLSYTMIEEFCRRQELKKGK